MEDGREIIYSRRDIPFCRMPAEHPSPDMSQREPSDPVVVIRTDPQWIPLSERVSTRRVDTVVFMHRLFCQLDDLMANTIPYDESTAWLSLLRRQLSGSIMIVFGDLSSMFAVTMYFAKSEGSLITVVSIFFLLLGLIPFAIGYSSLCFLFKDLRPRLSTRAPGSILCSLGMLVLCAGTLAVQNVLRLLLAEIGRNWLIGLLRLRLLSVLAIQFVFAGMSISHLVLVVIK